MSGEHPHGTASCSFCGKSQREVRKLVSGPAVHICDECIGLCSDILAEEGGLLVALDAETLEETGRVLAHAAKMVGPAKELLRSSAESARALAEKIEEGISGLAAIHEENLADTARGLRDSADTCDRAVEALRSWAERELALAKKIKVLRERAQRAARNSKE